MPEELDQSDEFQGSQDDAATNEAKDEEQSVFNRILDEQQNETESEGQPEDGQEEETESDDSGGEQDSRTEPEGVSEAYAALLRDGIPKSRIDAWLSENPEEFVKHGLKRQKAQAAQDQFGNEYKNLLDGSKKPSKEVGQVEQPNVNDSLIDSLIAPLGSFEENGDLRQSVKPMVASLVSGFQESFNDVFSEISNLKQQLLDRDISSQRQSLQENEYPQLADDSRFQAVSGRAKTLIDRGVYSDPGEAFRAAAAIELSEARMSDYQTKLLTSHQKKKDGQPRVKTKAKTEPNISDEQKEEAVFNKVHNKHYGALAF